MKVAFAYAASGGLYLMQPIMTTRIKSNVTEYLEFLLQRYYA